MKILCLFIGVILAFVLTTLYACLVVAGRADREMEAYQTKQQETTE